MADRSPSLVLVAENSDAVRDELLRRLGERGHRVAGAADGDVITVRFTP